MINVGKYPSIKVKNSEYSAFIKFNYNAELVEKVKCMPVRYYEPTNKVWEVPISDIDRIVSTFGKDNIKIFNDFPEFTDYLQSLQARSMGKKSVDEILAYYETITPIVDYKFKTKPDGHQIEAFNIGIQQNNVIITDVMGLGKTFEALSIMDYRKYKNTCKHVLVICGVNGIKYNWVDEIRKHSHYNCQVIDGTMQKRIEKLKNYWMFYYNIINIESIRFRIKHDEDNNEYNDNEFLNVLIELCDRGKFDGIILDEFHKANNHKSKQGKGLKSLKSKYKIALSGTPITKHIERSWNILNWMDIEQSSYWQFVKRYCILGGFSGWDTIGYKNLDELHERFDKCQIRRTKDILKLPPKTYQSIYIEMDEEERRQYRMIKRGIIAELGEVKQVNPAVATIKLRMFTDKIKARAVKDTIIELNENDQPCVVFSSYKEGIYNLCEQIKDYNPLVLTGDITDASKKQEIVNSFQNESKSNVLIGTIQALGTGYTLTRSNYVLFLNKFWTPTDNEQAEDRCHRRGTTKNVTIITYIVKDSIDERVEEILANDKLYIDKVVDGIPIFKKSSKEIFEQLMED